jgi:short-subunit dehydrogenase
MRDPRSILITGASSGIGAALARLYAAKGVALALGGRDAGRLAKVAVDCRAAGAVVSEVVVDVTDRAAMESWVVEADRLQPIDLLVANAGVSAGTGAGEESAEQLRAVFSVNVDGAFNTVLPLLPAMRERRRGQIALMSSLASFRGFPGAPAYSASKAALRVWGEGLRGDLYRAGITVSVICPGFVASPMTSGNSYPMPMLMPAEQAARIIRRGLAKERARIAFPLPMYAAAWILGALPPALTDSWMRRLPKKR